MNGELPKSAIGQSWRMASGEGAGHALVSGAAGAMRGHDMVMSPYRLTYYAIKQGLKDDPFERDGGVLTLEMAYSYDPLAGVPEEARVAGGRLAALAVTPRHPRAGRTVRLRLREKLLGACPLEGPGCRLLARAGGEALFEIRPEGGWAR